MENKSMLSLMAAAEALGSRSALLQAGVSISADEFSLRAERVALIDEFKRREAELADLRAAVRVEREEMTEFVRLLDHYGAILERNEWHVHSDEYDGARHEIWREEARNFRSQIIAAHHISDRQREDRGDAE